MQLYSQRKILKLLHESDSAATHDEKGEKLEQLTKYLIENIKGVSFYRKNILDGNRAHELDLAFWNPQNLSDLSFLDASLIVECKNTGSPTGSNEVGWLVRKLQDRGAFSGILISLNGVTGSTDRTSSAHSEILSSMVRDKIKILVVTRQELVSLQGPKDLVALLRSKYLNLTIEKTVLIDGR